MVACTVNNSTTDAGVLLNNIRSYTQPSCNMNRIVVKFSTKVKDRESIEPSPRFFCPYGLEINFCFGVRSRFKGMIQLLMNANLIPDGLSASSVLRW